MVAGCDGVNSVVRRSIATAAPAFRANTTPLPGNLKVVRLDSMPSALNTDAVSVLPGSPVSAFVEPTRSGACVLLTWRDAGGDAGSDAAADLARVTDPQAAARLVAASLPLLAQSLNVTSVGEQLVRQRPSAAATVLCNSYHAGYAVLLGDAAHSTGGASGQGCNSALQDAASLVDYLLAEIALQPEARTPGGTLGGTPGEGSAHAAAVRGAVVGGALLQYSRERVPEGRALLELSTGPGRAASPLRRTLFALSTAANTLLSRVGLGAPLLQTELTTSLAPFAEIRRRRAAAFGPFPDARDFERDIAEVARSVVIE